MIGSRYKQRKKGSRVRRFLKILSALSAIACICLVVVYWQRDALRRYGNEWSAERHLLKAEQEFEVGNFSVALRRAITALQLKPGRIETTRVLAAAARKTGDSRTLILARMLFTHGEATIDDKIGALAAVNDIHDAPLFERFWNEFPEESRDLIPARIEYVRYLLNAERFTQAMRHLDDIDAVVEPELGLLKIQTLFRISGDEEPSPDALTLALALIEDPENVAYRERVFDLLASLKPGAFSQSFIFKIETALAALPEMAIQPTFPYTLQLAKNPDRRETIVSDAVLKLRSEHLDPLCLWLLRLEAYEEIIESVTEVQAYRTNLAFESRVRSLIALERFEDAFALLQYPPNIADRIGTLILRASVARMLGRESAETTAWQEALVEAGRDMTKNHYLKVSRVALAAGERRVAADALVAACRHPRGNPSSFK